jgi:hypothetical protein
MFGRAIHSIPISKINSEIAIALRLKSVIVSHSKTLATHGLYGFAKEKSKSVIVRLKSVIVSHSKTLATHGLYGTLFNLTITLFNLTITLFNLTITLFNLTITLLDFSLAKTKNYLPFIKQIKQK